MVENLVAAKPTVDYATSYIASVKEAFHGEPAKYIEFIMLLADWKAERIDLASFLLRVGQLFKDQPNLLHGLNAFLPPQINIFIPPEPELPDNIERQREEAENLLNKIKTRFQSSDTHIPNSFVKILEDFKEGNKSEKEVLEEVHNLFYDHEDLRGDFLRFLQ